METVGHTFPFHSLDRRGHHRYYHRTIRNVAGRFRIGGGKGNSATWRRGEGSRWRIKIFRDPTRDELRVSAIYPIKSLTVFHFRFSHRSKTHSSFRSSSFILRYLDSISLSLSLSRWKFQRNASLFSYLTRPSNSLRRNFLRCNSSWNFLRFLNESKRNSSPHLSSIPPPSVKQIRNITHEYN